MRPHFIGLEGGGEWEGKVSGRETGVGVDGDMRAGGWVTAGAG